jgi:CheY-like chemotaxis protein
MTVQARLRDESPPVTAASTLLVDADDATRASYRQSVQPSGCEITEASDGREALAKALGTPPALVITALKLPLLDGYALCDILRRDPLTAKVPILVITGDTAPAASDRALRMGADVVLVKPSTPEQILSETRRLIAESNDAREPSAAPRATAVSQRPHATPRRGRLSKSFVRFTTKAPPAAPPELPCPLCDKPLRYEQSHVGGVNERSAEQWDDYVCSLCGAFQYRHRTRALRQLPV